VPVDCCSAGGSVVKEQSIPTDCKKIMQKFFFISIHKPPASIRFAPKKHALAVTVEPLKFSPAEPVAYELS
jgi:hypothetical protein